MQAQEPEHHEEHELEREERKAGAHGAIDAQIVHNGRGDDHQDDTQRLRNARKDRCDCDRARDVAKRRDQDIVEQDRPPGEEAHHRPETPRRVAIDGSGDGERLGHRHIAEGDEHHRNEADHVHERYHPVTRVEDDSEDGDRGDRGDEHQPVRKQLGEPERTFEFLFVAERGDIARGRRHERNGTRNGISHSG